MGSKPIGHPNSTLSACRTVSRAGHVWRMIVSRIVSAPRSVTRTFTSAAYVPALVSSPTVRARPRAEVGTIGGLDGS